LILNFIPLLQFFGALSQLSCLRFIKFLESSRFCGRLLLSLQRWASLPLPAVFD